MANMCKVAWTNIPSSLAHFYILSPSIADLSQGSLYYIYMLVKAISFL